MNPMWLMRMKQWVRHPPSKQRIVLVGAAIVFCVAIYAAEQFGLLPEWAAAERMRLRP